MSLAWSSHLRRRQTEAVRYAQGQSQGRLEEARHCQHRRQLKGHIRFGSLADIGVEISDVRFTPNNGRWAAHPSQHLAVGL